MWLKPSVNCLLILFPNLWDLLIIPMYVSFTFPTYVCNYKQCIFSMFLRFMLSNHVFYRFLQIHFLSVLSLTFAQLLHTHQHVFLVYWFYCCIIVIRGDMYDCNKLYFYFIRCFKFYSVANKITVITLGHVILVYVGASFNRVKDTSYPGEEPLNDRAHTSKISSIVTWHFAIKVVVLICPSNSWIGVGLVHILSIFVIISFANSVAMQYLFVFMKISLNMTKLEPFFFPYLSVNQVCFIFCELPIPKFSHFSFGSF